MLFCLFSLNIYSQTNLPKKEKIEIHLRTAERILSLNKKQIKKYEKAYKEYLNNVSEAKKEKFDDPYHKAVTITAISESNVKKVEKILTVEQLKKYQEWLGLDEPFTKELKNKRLKDFKKFNK